MIGSIITSLCFVGILIVTGIRSHARVALLAIIVGIILGVNYADGLVRGGEMIKERYGIVDEK